MFVLLWHQGLYPTMKCLATGCQLASCWHVLQVTCWVVAAYRVSRHGDHIAAIGLVSDYTARADRLLTTLPILCPAISIFLDAFRSNRLATDLQQMSTWNKLSSLGYRHLTPISSLLGCNPWCHGGGWCVPSAAHRPCVHQNQNKVLIIRVLTLFLETLLYKV